MKKVIKFLFSMQWMAVLIAVFGISIAFATFIENDFGTNAARGLVYNARWFEIMLVILCINLIGNIWIKKLYRKQKLTIFLFHLSFVVIILGAGLTRYLGYEGYMHIREGELSNKLISDNTYFQIQTETEEKSIKTSQKILLSSITPGTIDKSIKIDDNMLHIKSRKYIPDAVESVVPENEGKPAIHLVYSGEGTRKDLYLFSGEKRFFDGISVSFNVEQDSVDLKILKKDAGFVMFNRKPVVKINMFNQTTDSLKLKEYHVFEPRNLYSVNGKNFVFKEYIDQGTRNYYTSPNENSQLLDALILDVSFKNHVKEVILKGKDGMLGDPKDISIGGQVLKLSFGSKIIFLPFQLQLNDFIVERYPGSNSPSSFESDIVLIDLNNEIREEHVISMNNVLKYKGYRFYQSSYDSDEKGTILSVNHDFAGTMITYIGYILLTFGMITSIFNPNSRLQKLARDKTKTGYLKTIFFIGFMLIMPAQTFGQKAFRQELSGDKMNIDHAEKFGKLLVQDKNGRIEPVNTLSSEILRKVARKNQLKGLNPDQVFLDMMIDPKLWQKVPMIKVSNQELKNIINIDGNYAGFIDFFRFDDKKNHYLLESLVERAYKKNPANRDKLDNELIKVDERVNICYLVYTGLFFKALPVPGSENDQWFSHVELSDTVTLSDSIPVRDIVNTYFNAVHNAKLTGNWEKADKLLLVISDYQKNYGKNVIPGDAKIRMEILYNKYDVFSKLSSFYLFIGLIILVLLFINELRQKLKLSHILLIFRILVFSGFFAQTAGMAIRWYISGYAPWSNGYESLIYISWATILAGLVFSRHSFYAIATTSILSGIILMIAKMSWMDPEITTLVPVLKSYWLTIHVSVITASYGFLGLTAMLAFVALVLMIFKNIKNHEDINLTIDKIAKINEMSIILGLYLLTIGTFLGGVWANESWGRYWGWDPKETWALVTILVYAFIVHIRFIPSLNSYFTFNLFSLVGFGSVIMTYFGVNYYLSGLHSYAKGDPVPIPAFIYYMVFTIIIVASSAYYRNNKIEKRVSGENKQ